MLAPCVHYSSSLNKWVTILKFTQQAVVRHWGPLKLSKLTYFMKIQLQKASYIPKASHPSYLQSSILERKSTAHTERKGNLGSKTLSNLILEQINKLHKVSPIKRFYVLGWEEIDTKTLFKPEIYSVFEGESCRVYSSTIILFDYNGSHKVNPLWSVLNIEADRLSNISKVWLHG